ncbi:MAG: substrate-binding domain-containing protein [Fimbriimonadaceae bacterium]|nr:substrate-binding domain-containing protein [Chthonomonadaceae bacterium]MCO5295534.1 substrate-binding domain-containing protein [Fimbriimonadaceae bacterium]
MKWMIGALAALVVIGGCGSKPEGGTPTAAGEAKPLVAFAQANSQDPWRQVFDKEIQAEAAKHGDEFAYEQQSAEDDPNKQISVIDTLLVKTPKVLLVSPVKESVQQTVEKAYDAGIPVILLDRGIPGDKYTCLIGGDNVEIGRKAGEYLVERLGGKGTVLMIQGLGGASATLERAQGAMEVFKKNPGITVIEGDDCKYQRKAARDYMDTFLQSGRAFDAVYCHNDEMAIGAYLAMEAAGTPKKIIVGVDGCQKEIVQYILDGKVDATFKYPIPGPEGIRVAASLLKGEGPPADKKIVLPTEIVTKENADAYLKANPNLF